MLRVLFCLFATGAGAMELPAALRLRLEPLATKRSCEFELRRGSRPEIREYDLTKATFPNVTINDLVELDRSPGGAVLLAPVGITDDARAFIQRAGEVSRSPKTQVLSESAWAFSQGETPGVALLLNYRLRGQGQNIFVIFPKETYPTGLLVAPQVRGAHTYLNGMGVEVEHGGQRATILPVRLEEL